jgi:hypothetical protein
VTEAGLVYAGIGRPVSGPEFEQPARELAPHLRSTRGRPRSALRNGKRDAA